MPPQKLHNEGELTTKVNNDNYLIKKVLKFTVLGVIVFSLIAFSIGVLIDYFSNLETRATINALIIQNLAAIVLAGLYIIGYNFLDSGRR